MRAELSECLEHLFGSEVNAGFVDVKVFIGFGCRNGEVGGGLEVMGAFVFTKPLLVAVAFPVGEVAFGNVADGFAEGFEDGFVRDGVANHGADLIAECIGEASDFAVGWFHRQLHQLHGVSGLVRGS